MRPQYEFWVLIAVLLIAALAISPRVSSFIKQTQQIHDAILEADIDRGQVVRDGEYYWFTHKVMGSELLIRFKFEDNCLKGFITEMPPLYIVATEQEGVCSTRPYICCGEPKHTIKKLLQRVRSPFAWVDSTLVIS